MPSKPSTYLGSALAVSNPILREARLEAIRLQRVLFLAVTASRLVQLGQPDQGKKSLLSQSFAPGPKKRAESNRDV